MRICSTRKTHECWRRIRAIFNSRLARVNSTTQIVIDFLSQQRAIKAIYSPLTQNAIWGHQHYSPTSDASSLPISTHPALSPQPHAGFGGLFSIVLQHPAETSAVFYDNLKVSKGPSLGNNFTLCCPYTLLAHYTEIDWAQSVGIDKYLLRFSVGLEDPQELCKSSRASTQFDSADHRATRRCRGRETERQRQQLNRCAVRAGDSLLFFSSVSSQNRFSTLRRALLQSTTRKSEATLQV